MMFAKCPRLYGEANILTGKLSVDMHHDVVLDDWALYDRSRRLIQNSAYFRGVPSYTSLAAKPVTRYEVSRMRACLEDRNYFWLGPVHLHFGHFLVSTLARAWAIGSSADAEAPIVYVGGYSPKRLFEVGFVRDCFQALGLTEDRLLQIKSPVRIPRIMVAAPAFTENHSAHPAFFRMLNEIATHLGASATSGRVCDTPIYVSKERVSSGVRTILNEAELTYDLQKLGVEIAYPETLQFREQLAFWARRRVLFGFASSAFHMAAFFGNIRLCTISHEMSASTNQILLDRVSGNDSLYVYPTDGMISHGSVGGFSDAVEIKNPAIMATDIVRLAESYGRSRTIRAQCLAPEPRSLCQTVSVNDPFGTNIAGKGKATQSSIYHLEEGYHRSAEGAISGYLTGHYQCHTEWEENPWWQVEFNELNILYEIRVYNRCDLPVAQLRLNRLVVSWSKDGVMWDASEERSDILPVGGLEGEPYRWLAPSQIAARFVRLQLPEMTYLHLDQVEVFGERGDVM